MKPASIEEYLSSFPDEQRGKLSELYKTVKAALPNADEKFKWGSPAFLDKDGMILVVISGHKYHMNLVATPSTKQAFADELTEYDTGSGSIKITYEKELPTKLTEKIVKYRANEYREHGVKWK